LVSITNPFSFVNSFLENFSYFIEIKVLKVCNSRESSLKLAERRLELVANTNVSIANNGFIVANKNKCCKYYPVGCK